MRAAWLAVGLCLVALAGCSGGKAPASNGEGPQQDAFVALSGVVVTPAIVPLPGVALELQPGARHATTDAQGRFSFDHLREGEYTLQASHAGFRNATQTVHTGPQAVNVVLEPDPRVGAYADAYAYDGYVDQSFNAGGARGNGGTSPNYTIGERAPDLIQMELIWDSTQAFGTYLDLTAIANSGNISNPDIARADGESPLLLALNSSVIRDGKLGPKVFLDLAIFAGQNPVAADRGVGVVVNQPYRLITHMFYGYLPPDGWRFTSDGDPPPPP